MKYFDQHVLTGEIRAESLITAMFDPAPECEVSALGNFFRNYCEDVVEIHKNLNSEGIFIELARDGIFHYLPEAIFFPEDRLLKTGIRKSGRKLDFSADSLAEEIKNQNHEKNILHLLFRFLDTQYFKASLRLEEELHELEKDLIRVVLQNFFDFDLDREENEYIRKLAPFLVHASQIRGDIFFIRQLLSVILHHRVEIKRRLHRAGNLEDTCLTFFFIIHIEDLSIQEYRKLNSDYEPFFRFVNEWFLPAEAEYIYRIKDKNQRFVLQKPLILDYNTQLK
jgi:hypothetical protein